MLFLRGRSSKERYSSMRMRNQLGRLPLPHQLHGLEEVFSWQICHLLKEVMTTVTITVKMTSP
eukprot:10226982-Ditylum_brightwellii.AAC.1